MESADPSKLSLLRRAKWKVILSVVVLALVAGGVLFSFVIDFHRKSKIEEYFRITLGRGVSITKFDDSYSSSFMDGTFQARVKADKPAIERLMATPPPWANAWQTGFAPSLARQAIIPDTGNQMSAEGMEQRKVFKVITIDLDTSTVYFEMKSI